MTAALLVRSPQGGELLGEVSIPSPALVVRAVERARQAQVRWGDTSPRERASLLAPLASHLLGHARALAEASARETGKPVAEALSMEILPLLELVRSFTRSAPGLLEDRALKVRVAPHKRNVLAYPPRGVVALIAPYNFPLAIGGGEALLALLAGNAVVLKPSEMTTLVSLALQRVFLEVGLDPDLFQVVAGGPATAAALVESGVDFVGFTGSTLAGRAVGRACVERGVPFRLELGGKAAAVVRGDADLDRTAPALVWGGFANGGQVCAGVQRVFVDARRMKELVDRIVAEAERLLPGDPLAPGTDLGFLCPEKLPGQVRALVEDAVAKGAGRGYGEPGDDDDRRVRPIVLTGPSPEARLLHEECFGPVLLVTPTRSDDEAVALANAGPGDLCAYLFTEDGGAERRLTRALRAGTVMVNDVVWSYGMPEAPWAAVSRSGFGTSHGEAGLRAYCAEKHVVTERARVLARDPYWYPYTESRVTDLRRGMAALYGDGLREKAKGVLGLLS